MLTDLPLKTDRLILRRFEPADLKALEAYYSLPEVQRYLDWKARDRVEVRSALTAMAQQYRLTRPGDTLTLAVTRGSDGALLGQVSLRWTDATAGQAELRFVMNPLYRRQGFGAEAVRAALDLGFDKLGFHRIFARVGGDNQVSARLLKAIGMRLEAHYREHALFQGEWDEELHFAMLDREWRRGDKVREITRHKVA
jgi:RimJ/RimL family protein N-acetyltransferase